jgi:DNA-binding cell septation regulator SpoVG
MKAKIARITWLKDPKSTLAFLDIEFEGFMIVKGWKIMDGQNGRWLAAPSRKGKDDKYYPDVTFASKEVFQGFQDYILKLAAPKQENGNPDGATNPDEIAWNE